MKRHIVLLGVALIIVLSGCGSNASNNRMNQNNATSQSMSSMNHSEMNDSGSGEVPAGLKEAASPKFKVGSEAIINADHMKGMKGAAAKIVGAYDTIAYVVSYTPTTGGEPVKNHKWVIQQEIKDAGDKPLDAGADVTLEADHMPGMMGAKATIESAERTSVYMVDYTPTTGGDPVKNHKWVTESELTSK